MRKQGVLKIVIIMYNMAHRDVAQLGSALPWGGRGRAFKSRRSDHAAVAQWIEQAPPKR